MAIKYVSECGTGTLYLVNKAADAQRMGDLCSAERLYVQCVRLSQKEASDKEIDVILRQLAQILKKQQRWPETCVH